MKPLSLLVPHTKLNPEKPGINFDHYNWKGAKNGVKKSAESKRKVTKVEIFTIGDLVTKQQQSKIPVAGTGRDILIYLRGSLTAIFEDDILKYVRGRKQAKINALRRLVRDEIVERDGKGVRNDPYRYWVKGKVK